MVSYNLCNLKLVEDVCVVLLYTGTASSRDFIRHGRVVLGDPALLISAECIAAEVGVCRVQIALCLFGLFGIRLMVRHVSILAFNWFR